MEYCTGSSLFYDCSRPECNIDLQNRPCSSNVITQTTCGCPNKKIIVEDGNGNINVENYYNVYYEITKLKSLVSDLQKNLSIMNNGTSNYDQTFEITNIIIAVISFVG